MRVIAGTCRGLKLKAPQGAVTRPTADRVKESLFNILSSRIEFQNISVLDICAGTGGLGIEALSRGAAACSFIESDRHACDVLRQNISAAKFNSRAEILSMDSLKALPLLAARGRCYDLVLFDPPYDSGLYEPVFELLCSLGLLHEDGLLVSESSSRNMLPESFRQLLRNDRRTYGDTALEFFTWR